MSIGRALRWGGSAFLGASVLAFLLMFSGSVVLWPDNPEEVLAEAQRIVGLKPPYPAKPSGKTIKEKQTEFHDVQTCDNVPAGIFGLKQVCKTTKVPTEVTKERFVNPDNLEIAKWQTEVNSIDQNYNKDLNKAIKEVEVAKSNRRREVIKDWATILSPVASTILGFGMLMLGIRKDRREVVTQMADEPLRRAEDALC